MDQGFRFGFANDQDDDEDDDADLISTEKTENARVSEAAHLNASDGVKIPKLYTLHEMIQTLPDQMSYAAIDIETQQGRTIRVFRRELFDMRAQLMAEDPLGDPYMMEGLSTDDITPGFYEGGLKTWECSVDLARYIASQPGIDCDMNSRPWHIIELGAGSALPTLVLFILRNNYQAKNPSKPPLFQLTLADYNSHVLHLATIPNLLINHETQQSNPTGTTDPKTNYNSLEQSLSLRNIHIATVSGPWGNAFDDIMRDQTMFIRKQPQTEILNLQPQTLVLASETIYSPDTIPAFASTLFHLLTTAVRCGGRARAFVAAKRFYFGVGGGVDDFMAVLPGIGLRASVVWESGGEGPGRVILEVTLEHTLAV